MSMIGDALRAQRIDTRPTVRVCARATAAGRVHTAILDSPDAGKLWDVLLDPCFAHFMDSAKTAAQQRHDERAAVTAERRRVVQSANADRARARHFGGAP